MNEPTENRVSIALRPDIHAKAKNRAAGEGKTLQGWVEQGINFALRHMDVAGKLKTKEARP